MSGQGSTNLKETLDRSLEKQRTRIGEFLASHRERLERAETDLAQRIKTILEELAKRRLENESASQQLEQRAAQVDVETEALKELQATLDETRQTWSAVQHQAEGQQRQLLDELQRQQAELAGRLEKLHSLEPGIRSAETKLAEDRRTLEIAAKEHEAELVHIGELKQQLAQDRAQLDAEKQNAASQWAELEVREKSFAQRETELKDAEKQLAKDKRAFELAGKEHEAEVAHVAELKKRLEQDRAELDADKQRVASQLAELEGRDKSTSQRESELRTAEERLAGDRRALDLARNEFEAEREHVSQLKGRLTEDRAELESRESRLAAAEKEIENRQRTLDERREEIERLQNGAVGAENERQAELTNRLHEAERKRDELAAEVEKLKETVRERAESADTSAPADSDLQRRYEMAMEDVRELKEANAKLEQQLASAPTSAAPTAQGASDGALDWEAQKLKLLAALENEAAEEEEADEKRAAERLEIEAVIKLTDDALAEKDREIADLRQLLSNQSNNIGSVAVGAAALGEVLDTDEIIREERESLKRIQEEWREKLREAEIEISKERAKLGRQKLEVEEKLRQAEEILAGKSPLEAGEGETSSGRRWLSRLGLADDSSEGNES